MIMETMLAIFDDPKTRDRCVAEAQKAGTAVLWIGDIKSSMSSNDVSEKPRPFCLFQGDRLAPLMFMGAGARSCCPV